MRITTNLSKNSIEEAIQKVREFRDSVKAPAYKVAKMVAEYGRDMAQGLFDVVPYDGYNDVNVTVEERKGGYAVCADGEAVCFIEFGTGVMYNTTNMDYPLNRPEGMAEIGEYGWEKGKQESWTYSGVPGSNGEPLDNGEILTHGNAAQYVLATTAEEMEEQIKEFAREVFSRAGH